LIGGREAVSGLCGDYVPLDYVPLDYVPLDYVPLDYVPLDYVRERIERIRRLRGY